MKSVWKIGSHWGNQGESVLDLFLDYGCVFFGDADSGGKVGNWRAVMKGDLFIISDGATPVAIGEALGIFKWREESGIAFRARDVANFLDGVDVVVCPARIRILSSAERGQDWGIDSRKRFCRAYGATAMVNEWWDKHVAISQPEDFEILSRVMSLYGSNGLFSDQTKYRVPIYQRPYSWGEAELRRLMEDLRQGMENKESIFLGTMQLGEPAPLSPDGKLCSYDIIDGQQRLTTFLLLLTILESLQSSSTIKTLSWGQEHFRTAVNKRAAQDDLDAGWAFLRQRTLENWNEVSDEANGNNAYIINAYLLYGLIKEFSAQEIDENVVASDKEVYEFASHLLHYMTDEKKIKVVVIETHAGLSKTLKIFDSINSAGMDLGVEDLFKIHFYEYRRMQGDGEIVFDDISEIYEMVAEYNRQPAAGECLSMKTVLGTWQRVIIAENKLNAATFAMSADRFFDQLFETQLGIHIWPDFRMFKGKLAVSALRCVAEKYIEVFRACEKDVELKIWHRMIWETRYGYADDYPVLALFRSMVNTETLKDYMREFVKALVPASLYFGRHVYAGRAQLLELLRAMWEDGFPVGGGVGRWCRQHWHFEGRTLSDMLMISLNYAVAGTLKWKNLLCKLVEILSSTAKDEALYKRLFQTWFDVEHIQSSTDEKDAEKVRQVWGAEIDKIGNLVMLEMSLNRSIHNHAAKKEAAYAQSHYASVQKLRPKVGHWTKADAETRKQELWTILSEFLLSDQT